MVFDVFREGLAVGEVPRLRVEAALAVVRASGDKERVADAGTICDIVFFDVGVVHDSEMFLMDKMGSGLRRRLRRILDDGILVSSAFPSRGRCPEGADRAQAA